MRIRRPLALVFLLFILLVMCCVYSGAQQEPVFPREGEKIELMGRVIDKEYKVLYGSRVLVAYLEQLSKDDNVVMCYMTDTFRQEEMPCIGEKIRVAGKVSLFRAATNPGEFDLRSYYQILNISYKLSQTEVLARSGSSFQIKEKLFQLKYRCADVLEKIYPEKEASVLKAMLLGEKSSLDEEMKELYQLSGLIHILSISGLHISLLGMALYKLLKRCYIPAWIRAPVSMGVIWCYGTMTGMSVSTGRAVFMFLLYLMAELTGRTYDMLTALAIAAVLMLIKQPLLVCHSGFLLSFGAVLGIAVVLPWWKELILGKLTGNGIQKGFLLSTAITITTMPILLYFYYSYPIYSLFLNLYVIPLMGFVLADGMISMGIGLFYPEIAAYFGMPDRIILKLYEISCEGALKIPGSILIGGQPEVWQILLYYSVLALLVIWNELAGKRLETKKAEIKGTITGLPFICQFMLVLFILRLIFLRPVTGFTVSFLDVGQGDCIVMVNENGNSYMVDGGSSSKTKVGKYQILPFLESRGIGELEAVFLTHPDEDHISGVMELMEQSAYGVKIKRLILPDVSEKVKEQEMYDLCNAAFFYKIPVYYIGRGDVLKDKRLMFICLNPEKKMTTDEVNEISTVLYITYGEFSILLTGDVTGETEKKMIEKLEEGRLAEKMEKGTDNGDIINKEGKIEAAGYADKKLTVLKVAHHGSRYSTPGELLKLTKPVYAVISAGKNNRYGHPHKEVLERLEEVGSHLLRTDESGAITIYTDGKKMQVEKFLE